MNTYAPHNMSVALPPARDLLLKREDEDLMTVDDKVHETMTISRKELNSKDGLYAPSATQQPQQRPLHASLSPMEPDSSSTSSALYEQQTAYSRRGSMATAIYSNFAQEIQQQHQRQQEQLRKPSITETNKLPLPLLGNSLFKDSIASSTAAPILPPSPSYHHPVSPHHAHYQHHHPYNRRDSVPTKDIENLRISLAGTQCHPYLSPTEAFHRRHSIATLAAADAAGGSNLNQPKENKYNHSNLSSQYQAFRFPATIPESASTDEYAEERPHHLPNFGADSSKSPPRKSSLSIGGGPLFQNSNRRRLSSLDDVSDTPNALAAGAAPEHQQQFLLMRRASVPAITTANAHQQQQQQQRHLELLHNNNTHHLHAVHPPLSGRGSRRGSSNSCGLMEQLENNQTKRDTPYSRSPELRVSHKLAERKRRKEMKNLFDELRDSLPVDKNIKTSKWEILSKAVEYISILKRRDYELESELSELKHELNIIKREKGFH